MDEVPAELGQQLAWAHTCRVVLRGFTQAIANLTSPTELLAVLAESIGGALGVDRSLIYDVDLQQALVIGRTEWLNPNVTDIIPTVATYPLDAFRAGAEWMWNRREALESHADAPAAPLRTDGSAEILHGPMAIQSLLWFPFAFRANGYHLLAFNQVSRRRAWTAAELELIADASRQVEVALEKLQVLDDRSEALAAARRTAASLSALIANSPTGVLFESDQRRVQVANAAFCSLLRIAVASGQLDGADTIEVARTSAPLFTDPERFLRRTAETVAARQPVTAEEFVCADGRVLERDYVCVGEPGREGGHLWQYRDVTEQRRDQQRLRQLQRAIEQSPVGVIIADLQGEIVYVNERFTRMSGRSLGEVLGKTPRILKSPDTDPRIYEHLWSTITAGREWTGEVTDIDRSGNPFPIRLSISPVTDDQGRITHYVALQEDLREQRRAAAALKAADERLSLAQKMEAVSRFAGGIAHDFNNMLTVIESYTSLALDRLHPEDLIASDLGQVKAAAMRAADLARRLLAFSRHDQLELKRVDLNEVVGNLERVLRRLLGEDVELVLEINANAGPVLVDPSQLEQAVLNLANNARDAMPTGGTLTLSTGVAEVTTAATGAPAELAPGTYTTFSVADTGTGMDKTTQARVFEPFFTTKETGKGTGLGLALVYTFVHDSGGAITVESQPGQGTVFTLWLPRNASPGTEAPDVIADQSVIAGRNEVVLVIEDDTEIRNLVRHILARAGYRVSVASNGGEALLWCERHGADVDLLLCDVVMPGMHGPDLIARLMPLCPHARVLFMSGYFDGSRDQLPAGAQIIAKPFDGPMLQSRVRACLDLKR